MAVFDVTSYGAVGNGTTDDITAVQAAASAVAAAAYGGELFFPAGVYVLNSLISLNAATSKPITVRGEHMHATRLHFTGANKGLKFIGSGVVFDGLTVRDLTLSTNGNGGTAIDVTGLNHDNATLWKSTLIDNVRIQGDQTASSGYFAIGVKLLESGQSIIRNLHYEGSRFSLGADTNNYYAGTGIDVDAANTFAAGLSIVDPDIARCNTGIKIARLTEGVTIRGGTIDKARIGVDANRVSREPWFVVSDCRIIAQECCLKIVEQAGLNVHNCYFSKVPDGDLTGSQTALTSLTWTGINCGSWAEMHIVNNYFSVPTDVTGAGKGTQRGIVMSVGAIAGERAVISGNIFDGGTAGAQAMAYGVWMQTGTKDSKILYNVFRNVTNKVQNDGSSITSVGNS